MPLLCFIISQNAIDIKNFMEYYVYIFVLRQPLTMEYNHEGLSIAIFIV